MPANVVDSERDEEKWEKAKQLAKEQGYAEEYDYIMGIYKKMKPEGIEKKAYDCAWNGVMKVAGLFEDDDPGAAKLFGIGMLGGLGVEGARALGELPGRKMTEKALSNPSEANQRLLKKLEASGEGSALDNLHRKTKDMLGEPLIRAKETNRYSWEPITESINVDSRKPLNVAAYAHEAGHAKGLGQNKSLWRNVQNARNPLAALGLFLGSGMGMAENETTQALAPAAVVAGATPTLIDEFSANRNAQNILKGVGADADMLSDAKRLLRGNFGRYAGGTAVTALATSQLPKFKEYLVDKFD